VKALLSIHRAYTPPLATGRTHGPRFDCATGLFAEIGSDLLLAKRRSCCACSIAEAMAGAATPRHANAIVPSTSSA
jgi:hypothetical protein